MRVRSLRLLFACVPCLSLGAWTAPACAQVPETRAVSEPPPPFVFGSVQCPDPKAVQQSVLSLVPLEHHALLGRGVRVELEDLGDSYRVRVWKDGVWVKKSYADPARDCDGRVRFAAVFAVLTLMPPELGLDPVDNTDPTRAAKPALEPEPNPAPPPGPPLPPRATPPPPPLPVVRLELSALYASAPAILEAPDLHAFGAELRGGLGRGALSGTVSVAYTERAKFELNGVRGDVTRLPVSLGVRLRSGLDSWALDADLGLLLVAQRVRATNLLSQSGRSSLDVGVRAGIQLERQFGPRFAPFFGTFLWFSPGPRDLSVLPQEVLGNLPYLWLGGAAGVSFGL